MVIFHIDVNNAFLSWEAVYRLTTLNESLDLREIPSVIGGDETKRHGIVLAKSTPAKAYGIRTAETLAEAKKKCPTIKIVPPRHEIYKTFSRELIRYLKSLTPIVEQYSIDEAFTDMTGCPILTGRSPVEAADFVREEIYRRFGYTVNIGVSSNKVLAKMASDFEKPNKVHRLFPDDIEKKMWPLPVGDLFLVGRASEKKLYNLGIRTIGELARSDKNIIRSHMGKHGEIIHDYANGIDRSPVLREQPESKGYGNSTTLPHDVTDTGEAKKVLLKLCESVGSRLRADGFSAHVIAVTIKDNQFRHSSHQCTMPAATNITSELYHYACTLFDETWDGSPIRLLGVSSSKLSKESSRQLNIFDNTIYLRQESTPSTDLAKENSRQSSLLDNDLYLRQESTPSTNLAKERTRQPCFLGNDLYLRQGKMEHAVDEIRKKYGHNAIFRASNLEK